MRGEGGKGARPRERAAEACRGTCAAAHGGAAPACPASDGGAPVLPSAEAPGASRQQPAGVAVGGGAAWCAGVLEMLDTVAGSVDLAQVWTAAERAARPVHRSPARRPPCGNWVSDKDRWILGCGSRDVPQRPLRQHAPDRANPAGNRVWSPAPASAASAVVRWPAERVGVAPLVVVRRPAASGAPSRRR